MFKKFTNTKNLRISKLYNKSTKIVNTRQIYTMKCKKWGKKDRIKYYFTKLIKFVIVS